MQDRQDLTECPAEHAQWLGGLDYYRNEIGDLEQRLLALARGGMDHEVARQVEHFQNQCIVQRNNIDELRHAIREHVSGLRHPLSESAGGMSAIPSDAGHAALRDGYASLEKVIDGLLEEFRRFLAGKG